MIAIYNNNQCDILICIVDYDPVRHGVSTMMHKIISPSLPTGKISKKQFQRQAAKALAINLVNEVTKSLKTAGVQTKFSVSHANDKTVILACLRQDVFYCGIDMEQLNTARGVRPFMLEYMVHSAPAADIVADNLTLSLILFCCMESIYKSLSAYRPVTFSVDDYQLLKLTDTYCIFDYIGSRTDIHAKNIICHYYQTGKAVIALTLMNRQLHSVCDEHTRLKL